MEAAELQQAPSAQTTESLGAVGVQATAEKSAAEIAAERRERKIEKYVDNSCIIAQHWLNPEARKPSAELYGAHTVSGYTHTANDIGKDFKQKITDHNISMPEITDDTSEYTFGYFKKRGIYETCTMRTEPRIAIGESDAASITYEAHGPGYRDDSLSRRDGLFLSVKTYSSGGTSS